MTLKPDDDRTTVLEVFEFVADPENIPKGNYAIEETRKIPDGPVSVGTTYQQVPTVLSRSQ